MDDTLTANLLREHFPDECLVLGDSTVDRLLRGSHSSGAASLPGGRDFDLHATLEFMAAAIALTRALLEAYPLLRARLQREPSPVELSAAVKGIAAPDLELKRLSLAEATIKLLSKAL